MATSKRIFCDTNILLDVLDAERPYHDDAVALLWYAAENPVRVELLASISSFKDAYYILTRLYRDEPKARKTIDELMGGFFTPVDLLASYGSEAMAADEPDFEDALIGVSAEHEEAFILVTRDASAFAHCSVPVMSAAELLAREGFEYESVDWR